MRLLLFGDGQWATASLKRLVQEHYDLVGVVASPRPEDPTLLTTARELKIPTFQPARVNDTAFFNEIRTLAPSLMLSVFYDQIFHRPLLQMAELGCVNFHHGKLPLYRGRDAIRWAMINGATEIGLTAHYMDEGIDTGDIILQYCVPVYWMDTYCEVIQRITHILPELVAQTVRLVEGRRVHPIPQSPLSGTYSSRLDPQDCWINWSDTSRNIYNKIRAITYPGPGAHTWLGDQTLTVWRAFYDLNWPCYLGCMNWL